MDVNWKQMTDRQFTSSMSKVQFVLNIRDEDPYSHNICLIPTLTAYGLF